MLQNSRNPRRALWRRVLAFLALGLSLTTAGRAQVPGAAGVAPTIRNIEIKFTGTANVSEEIVRSNMSLREGMPYDPRFEQGNMPVQRFIKK